MHSAIHHRDATAKGDDQIAFENATSCKEAGRYESALEWYAEVKRTGGRWDISASTGRVALLLALHRAEEAMPAGMDAIVRMKQPNADLIGETARAVFFDGGPDRALKLCQYGLRHLVVRRCAGLWLSAAAYASQLHQFERCLRYLVHCLELSGGKYGGHLFLDRDFAALWHHLETEPLTHAEAAALRSPQWQAHREALMQSQGQLSFESLGHVPPPLRAILRLHLGSMTWLPHRRTPPAQLAAYASWCEAVIVAARESLDCGLRKALAELNSVGEECP